MPQIFNSISDKKLLAFILQHMKSPAHQVPIRVLLKFAKKHEIPVEEIKGGYIFTTGQERLTIPSDMSFASEQVVYKLAQHVRSK